MEDDSSMEVIKKWMKDLSDGTVGHEIEALATKGIRVVKGHKGSVLCDFVIHKGLSDENGNWDTGAIATLVDVMASTSSFSYTSYYYVTLDFSISYYSTAKIQEEVEVEAKAVGKKDELVSVMVEVRKKDNNNNSNRELIALGKLWMAPLRSNPKGQTSSSSSKL